MIGQTRNFFITEEDLAALEANLSLIYAEGVEWSLFKERPDLREAWKMTMETLSAVRFMYGPPSETGTVKTQS